MAAAVRLLQPLQPVGDVDAHVLGPAVLISVKAPSQNFATSPPSPAQTRECSAPRSRQR